MSSMTKKEAEFERTMELREADPYPENHDSEHSFTIILDGVTEIDDNMEEKLYTLVSDALLSSSNGVVTLDFDRLAETKEKAIESALNDISTAGFSGHLA